MDDDGIKRMHAWLDGELTLVSASSFFRKLWMVAVLEVPDSPTRSSGLFILTIWSRIQLALVVSTVGTTAKTEDEGTSKSQNVEIDATCLCEGHLICPHCSHTWPLPRISANFMSQSWMYLGTRELQETHFSFVPSKWKSYRDGRYPVWSQSFSY